MTSCTGAMYVCTHHVQEIGQIDNVRLTSHVFAKGSARVFLAKSASAWRSRAPLEIVSKRMPPNQMLRPDVDLAVPRNPAPKGRKAFRCWSIGRGPRLQPPGMAT